MKKLFIVVALLALLASQVYAGQNINALISDQTVSKAAKQTTSEKTSIEGTSKVSFFVSTSGTADTVTCEVTVEISYNGVDWLQASFKDFAGGATLQTSESGLNGNYYMWLDADAVTAKYVRINISAMNPETLGAADASTVNVTIVREQ